MTLSAGIFVIEHESDVAAHIESLLRKNGYQVCGIAATTQNALENLGSESPEIILMDIDNPEACAGIDAAARIMATLNIPIVLLTSTLTDNHLELAKKIKPAAYVFKPVQDQALEAAINTGLQIAESKKEREQAEQALLESEKRYRTLIDNAPYGIFLVNPDAQYIQVNKAGCLMTGYAEAELQRKTVFDLSASKAVSGQSEPYLFQTVLKNGYGEGIIHIRHKKGHLVHSKFKGVKLTDDLIMGVCEDITENLKRDQTIAISENKYRTLFNSMNEGVCLHELILDGTGQPADYRIIDVNPKYESFLGLTKDKVINRMGSDVYGSFPPPYLDSFAEVALTGQPTEFETYYSKTDQHFLISVFSPERHKFATVFDDITDDKRAEQKRKEDYKRLITILDSIPADIYVSDMETFEVLYMNAHMKESFGADHTGKICWQCFREDEAPCGHCPIKDLVAEGEFETGVKIWEIYNPINGKIYINYDRAIQWIDERYVHIQIAMDITERKKAEEALRQAHDRLELEVEKRTADYREAMESAKQANRLKSEFLANISHELRTPMHAILNYSKYGIEKYNKIDREKNLHYFQNISKAGRRLMNLLDNLLDLSKLEAGKVDYVTESVDLNQIVQDAVAELQSVLIEKQVSVDFDAVESLPLLAGDTYKIGQVVRNLLSNAIRYSPRDEKITIKVEESTLSRNDTISPALHFKVRDHGIGIPDDELGTIFDKFFQSSRTKTGAGGTGLGLAICREIVGAHKGRIWAENNVNGGATFNVLLPLEQ